MILVKNRQLLFSDEERYLGTTYDENSTNRIFRLERINEDGKDLASLDYNIDLIYMKDLTTDTAQLEKTVDDRYVYLTWLVSDISFSKPGAIKINLRGKEASGIVKWSSFQDIVYIAETGSPITPPEGSLTELEQIENQMSALSTSLQNAESERVTAEQERETAEQGRAAAESERQYEFEQTMGEFDEDKAQLEEWAKLSKSYAHGGSGVREGEDTDNSFYYMQQAGSQASAAATSASAAAQAKQDAEAAAEEAGEIASASIDNLTLKRNSTGVMYVDDDEVVKIDDETIGKTEEGELKSLVTAENFSVADKYEITEDEPTPEGTSTKKSFLQTMVDKLCNALVNTLVSTDSFQNVLKTYLANNGTTNVEGFGLDARYGKTLADQISSLNAQIQTKAPSLNPVLRWVGLGNKATSEVQLRKAGSSGSQGVSLVYTDAEGNNRCYNLVDPNGNNLMLLDYAGGGLLGARTLINGKRWETGTLQWILEPDHAYLFITYPIADGNINTNLTAVFLVFVPDTSSKRGQILNIYASEDDIKDKLTLQGYTLKWATSYQYCNYSITRL